jgi:hypothetical protein
LNGIFFDRSGHTEVVCQLQKNKWHYLLEKLGVLMDTIFSTREMMEKKRRNAILQQIKAIEGSTQRQIARVTGLNPNIVFKA